MVFNFLFYPMMSHFSVRQIMICPFSSSLKSSNLPRLYYSTDRYSLAHYGHKDSVIFITIHV